MVALQGKDQQSDAEQVVRIEIEWRGSVFVGVRIRTKTMKLLMDDVKIMFGSRTTTTIDEPLKSYCCCPGTN